MSKLPTLFHVDEHAIIERMQVEWFYTKYTQEFYSDYLFGHFMMAAYASVPAYLTPDLLYKLWQNFGKYQWGGKTEFIHNIAVSDVLLAPFCEEVGYELFRMEEKTRLWFLKWMNSGDPLWSNRSGNSLADIAAFVEGYFDKPNDTVVREGEKYREEQLMEVKVFTDPGVVARHYLQKLNEAQKANDERQMLAVINALKKAIEKENYTGYATRDNPNAFGKLFGDSELELWRHVLLQNNKTFAKLLGDIKNEGNDGSHLVLKKEEHSFTIQINESETELSTKLDSLVDSRNVVCIIGGSTKDADNCNLVNKTFLRLNSRQKWISRIFNEPIKPASLIHQLRTELKSLTPDDNLVVYIAAQLSDGKADSVLNYFDRQISIDSLKELFAIPVPASFTLIMESSDSKVPNLIDTNRVGNAFFFCSETHDAKSGFTGRFCDALSQSAGKITNRTLHIKVLPKEREALTKQKLLSNRDTYCLQFGSGDVQSVKVEHYLRLCGYLNKPASLPWDNDVTAAFENFQKDYEIKPNLQQAAALLLDKIELNKKEQKPILLFVFSDPEKTLKGIHEEIGAVKALKGGVLGKCCEIKLFQNRPLKEVTDFIENVNNRNRVQLFYYAAFDLSGAGKFDSEGLSISLFGKWLEFQDNMHLVLLNTCWSGHMADQLTQIGVGTCIGNYHQVGDDYAANFGIEFLGRIARRDWSFNEPLIR